MTCPPITCPPKNHGFMLTLAPQKLRESVSDAKTSTAESDEQVADEWCGVSADPTVRRAAATTAKRSLDMLSTLYSARRSCAPSAIVVLRSQACVLSERDPRKHTAGVFKGCTVRNIPRMTSGPVNGKQRERG